MALLPPCTVLHPRDLALARGVARRHRPSLGEFGERLTCVPAFLGVMNRRSMTPLPAWEVQDLAQDVHIAALKAMDSYRGEARIEVVIYQICRRRLANQRRDRSRRAPIEELQEAAAAQREEPDSEDSCEVWLAGSGLQSTQQDLVRRHVLEGESLASMARRMQLRESTLKSRYYAALSRLRRWMTTRPELP